MTLPVIIVTPFRSSLHDGRTLYMAHGPDGHTHLLARETEAAAIRDGLDYFLDSRALSGGRWEIKHSG